MVEPLVVVGLRTASAQKELACVGKLVSSSSTPTIKLICLFLVKYNYTCVRYYLLFFIFIIFFSNMAL